MSVTVSANNIGEELTGLYLQIERNCSFVQYNVYTPHTQGEIDRANASKLGQKFEQEGIIKSYAKTFAFETGLIRVAFA